MVFSPLRYSICVLGVCGVFLTACDNNSDVPSDGGDGFQRVQSDVYDKLRVMDDPIDVSSALPWLARARMRSTVSGHYLAGRFATTHNDLDRAAEEMTAALQLIPSDQYLRQRAFPAALGAGEYNQAVTISKDMTNTNTVIENLSASVLVANEFINGDYDRAESIIDSMDNNGFGQYLKPMIYSWIHVAKGNVQTGIDSLLAQADSQPSLRPLYAMHIAMMYDYSGNNEKAADFYEQSMEGNLSVRTAWLAGNFYERSGQKEKAKDIYQNLKDEYPQTTFASLALQRIQAPKSKKLEGINPQDGLTASFFDLASVLHQEQSSRLALLYAHVAHFLQADEPFVNILLGDIEAITGNIAQAIDYYKVIPQNSDFYVMAGLRLAEAYEANDQIDKAINTLKKLSKNDNIGDNVLVNLGDLLRRNEQYKEAIPYYTRVIKARGDLSANDWDLLYARGISYEQSDQWPLAETDLQRALALQPDQPYVLNYLGYSWADQGMNIDTALNYIQRAVTQRPLDGYIVDSMGWVLYQLGRYDEAVPYLEKAVEYVPGDPIINDHLGDAYWRVGRRLEAGFQWNRALRVAEDDAMIADIQAKIDNGLNDPDMASNINDKKANLNTAATIPSTQSD